MDSLTSLGSSTPKSRTTTRTIDCHKYTSLTSSRRICTTLMNVSFLFSINMRFIQSYVYIYPVQMCKQKVLKHNLILIFVQAVPSQILLFNYKISSLYIFVKYFSRLEIVEKVNIQVCKMFLHESIC